jgi:hypothetical protein
MGSYLALGQRLSIVSDVFAVMRITVLSQTKEVYK